MTRNDDLEAVGLLYDAALGHADWSDAGARLASLVGGATLTFTAQYAPDAGIDIVDMRGVTAKEVELYAAHYIADDLWINAALGRRLVNRFVLSADLVSDLEWQNSRIYTELCRPNTDVFHGVMSIGMLPGDGHYALGIHRPRRSRPFTTEAAHLMDRVAPHIRRALQIRSKFQQARTAADAAAAVLDNLSFGIIQVGATGRLVNANQAALAILRANDGLSLERIGLRARLAEDHNRLQAAIKDAAGLTAGAAGSGNGAGYLRIRRPSGARPYSVIVAPLGFARPVVISNSPVAMLIVTDPEAGGQLDSRALRTLFGFTPAEARLVNLLVGGRSLPDIAKELGISFETARTHLARARAKTETASQVDLVRTVLLALSPVRTVAPQRQATASQQDH